jgi:hypothetical protein
MVLMLGGFITACACNTNVQTSCKPGSEPPRNGFTQQTHLFHEANGQDAAFCDVLLCQVSFTNLLAHVQRQHQPGDMYASRRELTLRHLQPNNWFISASTLHP